MKKFYYLCLAAGLTTLASCSSDDFLGGGNSIQSGGKGEITFAPGASKMTRDVLGRPESAERLNNRFYVYGYTTTSTEPATNASDKPVFQNYQVNYVSGTAYTTESNTHNWEYVGDWSNYNFGNVPNIEGTQTIKYWNYKAEQYVFHGFSVKAEDLEDGNVTVNKVLTDGSGSPSNLNKGWDFTIKDAASLGDIYVANRTPITNKQTSPEPSHEPSAGGPTPSNTIGNYVDLKFRALASKIRFAMYETIPGYSVKIDKMYYTSSSAFDQNTTTNFAIDSDVKVASNGGTTVKVVYEEIGTSPNFEYIPKVSSITGDAGQQVFGTNILNTAKLGTSSNTATYDVDDDRSYTFIFPYTSTNDMKIKVDYTLTSTDGSQEEIQVTGATAVVPACYADWKLNYAYTYIFKISDNTNGTTGTGSDPVGLYPITFDACVVDAVTDVQETITTVADPSITTYAHGVIVTGNDEYIADETVYIAVNETGTNVTKANLETRSRLFEVYNYGTESITEETVANYENNYMILVEKTIAATDYVTTTAADDNGKTITVDAVKFTPEANKIYAYKYTNSTGKTGWKVIRVVGANPGKPNDLTLALGGSKITTTSPLATTVTLKKGTEPVLGAKNLFTSSTDNIADLTIAENATAGTYDVTLKTEAVNNGNAQADHKIGAHSAAEVSVAELAYAITSSPVAVNAGHNNTFNLKIGGADYTGEAKIEPVDGLTVTHSGATYTVAADATMTPGAYDIKVANQTVTVNVTNFQLTAANTTVEFPADNTTQNVTLYLKSSVDNSAWSAADLISGDAFADSNTGITLPTGHTTNVGDYVFPITSTTANGDHVITYLGAEATITVNKYTVTPTNNAMAAASGSVVATMKKNNRAFSPAAASWEILDDATPTPAVKTSSFNIVVSNGVTTITSKSAANAGHTYTVNYKIGGTIVATFNFTI